MPQRKLSLAQWSFIQIPREEGLTLQVMFYLALLCLRDWKKGRTELRGLGALPKELVINHSIILLFIEGLSYCI